MLLREFGGAYVPEILHKCVEELTNKYLEVIESEDFKKEFDQLLRDYVGRPSPLYLAKRLSEKYGCKLYLKTGRPESYRCSQNQQHHRTNLTGTPHGKEAYHRRKPEPDNME